MNEKLQCDFSLRSNFTLSKKDTAIVYCLTVFTGTVNGPDVQRLMRAQHDSCPG